MRLSNEDFIFLKNQLELTPLITEKEKKFIKLAHPQLYYTLENKREDEVALFTEKSFIYKTNNNILNKFLSEKFEEPIKNIYSIHRLIYSNGGFAKKHKDRFTTHKTVSIILDENFTGGEMLINDKVIEMKKNGDYIVFNGGNDYHEVKEIITGFRDVLIIWFSKKSSKFSII